MFTKQVDNKEELELIETLTEELELEGGHSYSVAYREAVKYLEQGDRTTRKVDITEEVELITELAGEIIEASPVNMRFIKSEPLQKAYKYLREKHNLVTYSELREDQDTIGYFVEQK